MLRHSLRLIQTLAITACLTLSVFAQNTASPAPHAGNPATQSPYVFHSATRMVSLDVVVEDSHGHHITGLKAGDFQIAEQTPAVSKEKHAQHISEFREVHTASLAPPVALPDHTAPGIFTNVLTVQMDPVPPTVIVVDGVNTEVQYQAQVHVQMMKILRQLPPNVPVAVLLMGYHLQMLQGFTTDHKLLQEALNKAESVAGEGMGHIAAEDDPDNPINLMMNAAGSGVGSAEIVANLTSFQDSLFNYVIARRFDMTYDAFLSISRSLAGYPGRKNLLWMTTSIPLTFNFDHSKPGPTGPELQRRFSTLINALSDANVAIYPVDLSGVTTLQVYSASARPISQFADPGISTDGARVAGAASREVQMHYNEQENMREMADSTGGKVCIGDNELGDCVHKAVDDSSDFYEISYYPESGEWNGNFRRILINTNQPGAHLTYRQGYFATPEGEPDPTSELKALRADCADFIDATAIQFMAKGQADTQGSLRFSLLIDPTNLSFRTASDGGRAMHLAVAACTYNEKEWLMKIMNFPLDLKLDTKEYELLTNAGHLSDVVTVPGPAPASVRLLVKDVASGKLGSILIKTSDLVANQPKPAGSAN